MLLSHPVCGIFWNTSSSGLSHICISFKIGKYDTFATAELKKKTKLTDFQIGEKTNEEPKLYNEEQPDERELLPGFRAFANFSVETHLQFQ